MNHFLKCWPQFFAAVKSGEKKFEIRLNDRDFKVRDTLTLQEWTPCRHCGGSGIDTLDDVNTITCQICSGTKGTYSGDQTVREVLYVMHGPAFGLQGGHCIMSIQ